MNHARPTLIEFPADDPARARRFWAGLLGTEIEERRDGEGSGWQTHGAEPAVGVHERGRGPGDSFSLPYFTVENIDATLAKVLELAAKSCTRACSGRSARTPKEARSRSHAPAINAVTHGSAVSWSSTRARTVTSQGQRQEAARHDQ